MRLLLIFILLLNTFTALHAADITSLNGFKLWQFKDVVAPILGEPFKIMSTENTTLEAHKLSPNGYMVFEYLKDKPYNIYSMQITGQVSHMLPFKGLVLGDTDDRVIDVLGAPTNTQQLNEPNVEVLRYSNLNASVEIDSSGLLYSIRAGVTNKMMSETDESHNEWLELKEAIKSKNMEKVLDLFRPDIEIYINGKTLTIDKRFSDFLSKPDKDFTNSLVGKTHSLLMAIDESEAESEMRISEKMGLGHVYKFYKGTIVKEVVFFPYGGKYRVYEIAFVKNKT